MESQPEPPPALQRKPDLYGDLFPVWNGFWDLNSSRPVGMGLSAIPILDIISYCREIHGLCGEDLRDWFRLIRAMDESYLDQKRPKSDGV